MIVESGAVLKKLTDSSAFSGYQTGNINEVRKQVAAVFAHLHEKGILYKGVPASFESQGQRITMPDHVLSGKMGNCIELSVLMASILESIGINSMLVIIQGHAFLAIWLVEDCYSHSVGDDYSFIEKKCATGIEEMMVLECTCLTNERTSFESAVKQAEQRLADHDKFQLFIDVARSRIEGIRPLPSRIKGGEGLDVDAKGVTHDQFDLDLIVRDRYDLSHLTEGRQRELTKLDLWERKLLDLTLRNSLLNLNLRRKAIQFISFDIHKVEDEFQKGSEYGISHFPVVDVQLDTSERLVRSKLYEGQLRSFVTADLNHKLLHTYKSEKESSDVLKNIYRSARNAIEETGANSLFLAIGTLRWFENYRREEARYAPILLLPVEMVYRRGQYFIRCREEDILLNVTLIEFLSQTYGLKFPGLDPLPQDEYGVNVSLIMTYIRDVIKDQKRWDVEEEMLLGIFSFSKFLMWNDIHSNRDKLCENDIISSLVANRLTFDPKPLSTDLKEMDKVVAPSDLALPVAVDSSQLLAVVEGSKGASFILYGPPGTGKSQTITNLIANALYHGKRVLFVAEKMAALNVVQKRLEKIGLGDFCLELHSNKSSKRHVLEQLDRALRVTHIASPEAFKTKAEQIYEDRKAFITYIEALHTKGEEDRLSLYDCIIYYELRKGGPLSVMVLNPALDQLLTTQGVEGVEQLLGSRLETVVRLVGQPSQHPLKGWHIDSNDLLAKSQILEGMDASLSVLKRVEEEREYLKDTLSLKEQLMRDNSPELLTQDAEVLRQQWRSAKSQWFIPRYFAKRNFLKQMKAFNKFITEQEVEGVIETLATYQKKHRTIEELRELLDKQLSIETSEDALPPSELIAEARNTLENRMSHSHLMKDWVHWSEYRDLLIANGLEPIVAALEREVQDVPKLRENYFKTLFRQKVEQKMYRSTMLVSFEGMLFDEKVDAYRKLTEEFQTLTQKELYARLASRIPRVSDSNSSSSEIGLLNRNISNGGRGLSLHDLFNQIPTLLPRLCPCMLMSPMSVAQYIDLEQEKFDLVIFDEASQMPTSDAVGAIARGNALIVVGDPKQMPPTSFFSKTNTDVEEAHMDDMESILEDCKTLELPSLQLSWHYRSRHESLITFSNNEYYDGSLITFPSVDAQSSKVYHVPIKGVYDKGGKRTNRAEAEAIIEEIVRRLNDPKLRNMSIGVISFSVVQQGLIEDLLQARFDADPKLQEVAQQMYEPIFVKNLENVQGDERDVILFSIGYGPDESGKVSMNFGPLNNSGGERRLNVAVSRARQEMWIFSTLKSSDIDLKRSNALGVQGLKHFLEFAESQTLPTYSQSKVQNQDVVLAEEIAKALTERGHKVVTNVGHSKFKINVAVADPSDPERFVLGILLDGVGYNETHTTRDREVVQPTVLNGLRWQVMRVWSVDWFNNRERVLERIEERLRQEPPTDPEPPQKSTGFEITEEEILERPQLVEEYTPYECTPAEAARMSGKELLGNIIKAEQPITFDLLCKRTISLLDLGRLSTMRQQFVEGALPAFYRDEYDTVWLSEDDRNHYRGYRSNSGRDITVIPFIEISNAITETLYEEVAIREDNLTLLATKKLGFTRRGRNVNEAMAKVLSIMKEKQLVETIGDNLRLVKQAP